MINESLRPARGVLSHGLVVGMVTAAAVCLACTSEAGVDHWRDGIIRGVSGHIATQGLEGEQRSLARPVDCSSIQDGYSQAGSVCLGEPRNFKGGVVVTAELIGEDQEWELAAAMVDGRWT